MQAVGRRVTAVVEGDRPLVEAGGQRVAVGALLDQTAGLEVVEQAGAVTSSKTCSPAANRFSRRP